MNTTTHIDDVLELAALTSGPDLWAAIRAAIPASHPRNDGEGGEGEGGDGEGGEGGGEGGQGGEGDGDVTMTKAEHDNLQRRLREATEASETAKREKEERERKDAEARGEHEKIAAEEREKREKVEAELAQERNERRVSTIATRLRFRDPTDVASLLKDADLVDEAAIERRLKAIAKAKPYLVTDAEKPKQRDVTGGDGATNGEPGIAGTSRMARAYGGSKTT